MASASARGTSFLALALGTTLLVGCSKAEPKATTATKPPASSVAPSASAAASTPKPSASAASTRSASLGGTCDDVMPVTTVDVAVGRPVIGLTAFIVGVPEPNIGRQARLNCRYGVAKPVKGKPTPPPLVEIGISLYGSAAQAAARLQGTVEDYRAHGASEAAAPVGQYSGIILLGDGSPTIVVSAGPRTVAVTADAKLIATGANKALAALAKTALDGTARFVQSGPVAASATPGTPPTS